MPNTPSTFIPGQPLHVRLYGRAGCPLCLEAAELLAGLHQDFDFWVERIDIDQDVAIRDKLSEQVPVVTINGGNRVATRVTEERLRRAFRRALKLEEESPSPLQATA